MRAAARFFATALLMAPLAWAAAPGPSFPEMANLQAISLAPGVYVVPGAVNMGVFVRGGEALLIDCCDSMTPERLARLGVRKVAWILCTQHKRTHLAGAKTLLDSGAQLVIPEAERPLIEDVASYWQDPKNRWHLYRQQPGPEVLAQPVPVARGVQDGEIIDWEDWRIQVLETPGMTDHSVSYAVAAGDLRIVFSGDLVYEGGRLWDVYSLQKGNARITDYHGFLGNRAALLASLEKVRAERPDVLVPSHGGLIRDVPGTTRLLEQRLDALLRNYASISALNFYFPELLADLKDDPARMALAETQPPPAWVRRVSPTSFLVVSESRAAWLVDCGADAVVDTVCDWLQKNEITSLDGCWVTHYHDDHVDALPRLTAETGCPVWADASVAGILEHPRRYYLPCISPATVEKVRATYDGETWQWREFTFRAFHFPGQTLYHGGLMVEGRGSRLFFAGDSGAPSGLDDYTAGNRVFLGADRGFRRCIRLWRELAPDGILNQHQEMMFRFSPDELDYMDRVLDERETVLREMTPWDDPNFATDPWWVRAYPYEQDVRPGEQCTIDVQLTNHGPEAVRVRLEPVPPEGWTAGATESTTQVEIPPRTCGLVVAGRPDSDRAARIRLQVPAGAAPGMYVVPFRVQWGARYLGPFRHALVHVRG